MSRLTFDAVGEANTVIGFDPTTSQHSEDGHTVRVFVINESDSAVTGTVSVTVAITDGAGTPGASSTTNFDIQQDRDSYIHVGDITLPEVLGAYTGTSGTTARTASAQRYNTVTVTGSLTTAHKTVAQVGEHVHVAFA